MEKFFQCFYCNQLIDNVYESECCGKLYCSNCISKLISKKCNLCQNNLFFQKNLFAQRMLKNIKIKCKYNCGKTLSYEDMKRHLLTCENKTYLCEFEHNDNNNNIQFKGNKNEILEHLKNNHPIHLLIFMECYYMFKNTINKIIKCNKNDGENENEDETVLDFTNSNNNEIISRFSGNDILPVNYIVNEDSDEDLLHRFDDRHYAFVPRFNRRGNIRMRRGGNHRFVRNIEDTISFESIEYNNINNNNNNNNNINNINNNIINNNNNNIISNNIDNNINNNNNINNIDNINNINNINESDFYD